MAGEAAVDSLKHDEATRKLGRRRPYNVFVSIGVALILVQAVLLAVLYSMQRWQVSHGPTPVFRIHSTTACPGVLHRTYWKIAAFARDQGHPPANLSELLGTYVDKLPADPRTGKPLEYSTDGQRFTLRCPG